MILVTAFAILTLITRARYTSSVRDSRYWDKKRFSKEIPPTDLSISCPSKKDISDTVNRIDQDAMKAYLSVGSMFSASKTDTMT